MGYALQGIITLLKEQHNLRIHLVMTLLVITAGFYLGVEPLEWCLLLLCIGGVWSAEAFNSAIEYLVDLHAPEHHPLAEKAKDVAAAAVLLFAITAAAIGLIIFLPYLSKLPET